MATIDGGVRITGFISPTDTEDTYAVIDPVYGVDGFRNVNSTVIRDAIPSERRRAGMIVGVKNGAFNDYYVLNSGNTTWSQIQMVTGLTWDLGSYDLTLNTFGGGITKNLSSLASDVTVTGGTYNSLNGIVTFSSSTTNTRTGLYYAGSWSALSAYSASTVVTYSGNSLDYYSIANVSANPTPPSGDTANWRPISSRGVFIVTGFTAGYTNIYTTAATYNQTAASIALDFTDPSKNLSITGVTTLYGKDDSIKSNRRVDLNQKTLNFSSSTAPNSLTISTGGTVGIGVLSTGTTKLHVSAATDPIRIEGIGGSSDSDVLTIDISGVVHTISVASLTSTVASSISTLYTSNGSLNSDRIVDLNQKTLNFSSSTKPNVLTISTGGTVGIGVLSGTNALHVSATANPVRIDGLTAVSATTKLVATNANNELVNFSGTNKSIPFFTSAGVITHSPTFTYDAGTTTRILQIDDSDITRASQITLGGGRGNIITPSTANSGLIFQVGLSTPFEQSKSIILRNGPTNYASFTTVGVAGGVSAHTATFNSTLSINNTGITTTNWGLNGIATRVLATSYTDSTLTPTATSETVASSFAIPTFTALTGKTYSALTNVYIAGAPIAGTNVTGLTSYALKVNTGTTYFGGDVTLSGISSAVTTTQLLTRESNGNVSFKNISDIGGGNVVGNSGATLYWYDENNTPPASSPVATGTGSIAFGNGAKALAGSMFVFGASGGTLATNASGSTFIGDRSGFGATFADNSLFVGDQAGYQSSSANNSTFIGVGAGSNASGANNSTFIGTQAGLGGSSANNSIMIGSQAGFGATSANNSQFFGTSAGKAATGATYSFFAGSGAGWLANSVTSSAFIGKNAGSGATNASYSLFIGEDAGKNASSATGSTFIGRSAGDNSTNLTGKSEYSIAIGYEALKSSSNNDRGVYIGYQAGQSSVNASSSVIIGNGTAKGITGSTILNGVYIGTSAGELAHTSSGSVFIGTNAGVGANGSSTAVMIGSNAGNAGDIAPNAVMIGADAGKNSTGADRGIFIGSNSGEGVTGTTNGIFIGNLAGSGVGTSNNMIAIGVNAGLNVKTAASTIIIGPSAGSGTTSNSSIVIGSRAGSSGGFGNNNIIIGTNITLSSSTTNSFNIGGVLFGTGCNVDDTSSSIFTAMTGGSVSIGTNKPNNSAILDLTSTSKGFLPPRVGTGVLPSSPAKGLIVHSDASGSTPTRRYAGLQLYDGTIWRTINPYKRYVVAVDIDSGGNMNAGYPIVLENELNTTIGVTYSGFSTNVMTISASTSTPFTTDKTAIFATCGVSKGADILTATVGYMYTSFVNSSTIQIAKIANETDRPAADYYTVIEIRVYD
jgi:hypothetical protein